MGTFKMNGASHLRLVMVTIVLGSSSATYPTSGISKAKSTPLVPSYPSHPSHPPLAPGRPSYPPWPEYPPTPEQPSWPQYPHPPHLPSPPPHPPPAPWPPWPPHPPRDPPSTPPPPVPKQPPHQNPPPPPPPEPADEKTVWAFIVFALAVATFATHFAFFADSDESASAFFRRQIDKIVLGGAGGGGGGGDDDDVENEYVALGDGDDGGEDGSRLNTENTHSRSFAGVFSSTMLNVGSAIKNAANSIDARSGGSMLRGVEDVEYGEEDAITGARNMQTNRTYNRSENTSLDDFANLGTSASKHHLRGASSLQGGFDDLRRGRGSFRHGGSQWDTGGFQAADPNAAYGMTDGVIGGESGNLETNQVSTSHDYPPDPVSTPRVYEDDYQAESDAESTRSGTSYFGGVHFYGAAARAGRSGGTEEQRTNTTERGNIRSISDEQKPAPRRLRRRSGETTS